MATLLKRLSMSLDLERRSSVVDKMPQPGSARGVAPSSSFNDFSMHIGQEVDDHSPAPTQTARTDIPRKSSDRPFAVGSAPAGPVLAPIATKALSIPRTSVSSILQRDYGSATPRSSLDDFSAGSVPTPHTAMSGDEPASPRSPTTPGGRRRRAQKIHGMDYYEFCELVRAGSSM